MRSLLLGAPALMIAWNLSASAGEVHRLTPVELDRVAAGAWQGYALSLVDARASGNAVALTQTANEARFVAQYEWRNGTTTSRLDVRASARGSGSGSGPGASSARASGRLEVSSQWVP